MSTDELAPLSGALDDGAAPQSFSVTDSQGGGESTFLDPVRDGLDQGYSIDSDQ